MYGLMVAFDPTRATPVSGGRSEGLNLWNLAVESKTTGNREHDSGSGIGRNIECWRCGGETHEKGLSEAFRGKKRKKRMAKTSKINELR